MELQRTNRRGIVRSAVFGTQPLWRSALCSMLERGCVGAVTICKTLDELLLIEAEARRPQLLVADPDRCGDFTAKLTEVQRALPRLTTIVVCELGDDEGRRAELLGAGVAAVIPKNSEVEEIEAALHDAIEAHLPTARLTQRELDVLELVAQGMSNREVGAALWLSDQTVKFHLANVYRKLGVASRTAAVEGARREGLLPMPAVSRCRDEREGGLATAAAL